MRTDLVGDTLLSLSGTRGVLQYVVLGGNAGDALIDLGFFSLAEDLGLQYEIRRPEDLDLDGCIVLSGGGGLVTEWSAQGTRAVIESLHRSASMLVVLPQTVRGNEELLGQLGPNVILFTREEQSFAHASRFATAGAKVLLDHDMAFNINAREFLDGSPVRLPRIRSSQDLVRVGLLAVAKLRGLLFSRIIVQRRDVERRSASKPWRLYNDLSFVCAFRGKDRATIENTGRLLLSIIDRYDFVRTDRLHVGVGAHLLGKRVEFVNNSNSKIAGVFQHSMHGSPSVTMRL